MIEPMIEPMIDFDSVYAPDDRHEGHGGPNECLLCRRPLADKAVATGWYVHLIHGGDHLAPKDWEPTTHEDHAGDVGWHPVGSECAKKVPLAYRMKDPR